MSQELLLTFSVAILLLPLAGFVLVAFFNKRLPRQGDWLETLLITVALVLSLLVMYQKL